MKANEAEYPYLVKSVGVDAEVQTDLRMIQKFVSQARIQKFFKGVGEDEEENFERKMFVYTRFNACSHKN